MPTIRYYVHVCPHCKGEFRQPWYVARSRISCPKCGRGVILSDRFLTTSWTVNLALLAFPLAIPIIYFSAARIGVPAILGGWAHLPAILLTSLVATAVASWGAALAIVHGVMALIPPKTPAADQALRGWIRALWCLLLALATLATAAWHFGLYRWWTG